MRRRPSNDDLLTAMMFLRADAEHIGDDEDKAQLQRKRALERVAAWLGTLRTSTPTLPTPKDTP